MKKESSMMKQLVKIIISLSLTILFLFSCIGIIVIFFLGAWLHTYKAFTSKKLIAEIEVTPKGVDDRGFEKFEVTYKQYEGESALMKIIFPNRDSSNNVEFTETYEMFGDTIFIEAHTVKLPDAMTLLNFKSVYKITGIEGDFVDDKEKAKQLPSNERSLYDLNGGVDSTWKWIKNNESKLGFIVDTVQVEREGKQVGNETKKWGVYITEEGLEINDL